jgi:hypothetical protein
MRPSARRRPGTLPSFWRNYHNAQLSVAASSMGSAASRAVREPGIHEILADYERGKRPPANHYVTVNKSTNKP